jgi:hypothetical protein
MPSGENPQRGERLRKIIFVFLTVLTFSQGTLRREKKNYKKYGRLPKSKSL